MRVEDATPWLFHLELQASYDAGLPWRMLRYNALLGARDELPVESVLLLLRPAADGPALTGLLDNRQLGRATGMVLGYTVIRLWEQPVDAVLAGGLSTLALAPIAAVEHDALAVVVSRVARRLEAATTWDELLGQP